MTRTVHLVVERHATSVHCGPVIVKLRTTNPKLGPVTTTWVGIDVSCPRSCAQHPANGGGCYADAGPMGYRLRRFDAAWSHLSPTDVALAEAVALDSLRDRRRSERNALPPSLRGRPLRLHASGDARTVDAARILADAVGRWFERGGGPAWTYTHAWRDVPRSAWDIRGRWNRRPAPSLTVVASVDSEAEIPEAREQGYRLVAMVVPEHTSDRAVRSEHGPTIPCPAQTRHRTCADCRLCLRERDAVITFAAHGPRKRKSLEVLR